MSLSMHAMTVGQFVPMLKNLGKILEKAEAYAAAKKIEGGVIEGLRLAPDMLSFARQIQLASDFAKNSTARLAGIEAPKFEDNEKTLEELKARVAKTKFARFLPIMISIRRVGSVNNKPMPLRSRAKKFQ